MATKPCSGSERAGRLKKARLFLDAADLVETLADAGDLVDATITLYVHAGIAGADVVCCARLGEHAHGQDHREAIDLLARTDRKLSRDLSKLLAVKTRAGYSSRSSSVADGKAAARSATRLVQAAMSA